jgi:hypothetical protein
MEGQQDDQDGDVFGNGTEVQAYGSKHFTNFRNEKIPGKKVIGVGLSNVYSFYFT